jgi:hypothetical protein
MVSDKREYERVIDLYYFFQHPKWIAISIMEPMYDDIQKENRAYLIIFLVEFK